MTDQAPAEPSGTPAVPDGLAVPDGPAAPAAPEQAHKSGPFVVPAFALVFCGVFLFESRSLTFLQAGYPRVIIGMFVILIALIVAREVRTLRRARPAGEAEAVVSAPEAGAAEDSTMRPGTKSWVPTIVISVTLVALVYAMPKAGSVLAIGIYSLIVPPLLDYRRHLLTIGACLVTVAIAQFVFVKEFGVPLP
jgi:Tripartite tricarboxylate transporter TctB family